MIVPSWLVLGQSLTSKARNLGSLGIHSTLETYRLKFCVILTGQWDGNYQRPGKLIDSQNSLPLLQSSMLQDKQEVVSRLILFCLWAPCGDPGLADLALHIVKLPSDLAMAGRCSGVALPLLGLP